MQAAYRIEAVSARPDLAPLAAAWTFDAFFDPAEWTVEALTASILAPGDGPKDNFVLFEGDDPAGTAALVRSDLDARPDLTPWLAGVFVAPAFRGRGYARALVRRVEAFAAAAGIRQIWLYTLHAEPLYTGLGWERVGFEPDGGRQVVLMRRDLAEPD